jgi:hypothetical protein
LGTECQPLGADGTGRAPFISDYSLEVMGYRS